MDISHQHMHNLGLLDVLARRSGAEVAALDLLAPYLEDYTARVEREDEFAQALMLGHGIPEDVVRVLRTVSSAFRAWGSSSRVDRRLRAGQRLVLRDRVLEVLHRPGHSPTDTVFWDADRRVLLAADHLIEHVSSNPLISLPPGADAAPVSGAGRPRALLAYLESLRATREMPASLVLPGHGEPIERHATLIDERLRLHDRRARKIQGIVGERPRSAYEIAQDMWGNVAATQAYLTLSEVLGHVDLLIDGGRLRERDDGTVVRFEPA
jgi:glyoxylase-like metal-dependent hydrolase (beta-lactamase superfamily II)